MSVRADDVEAVRKIFEKAKHTPRDAEGHFEDFKLEGEVYGALMDVGEKKIYELKDEAYKYLDDPLPKYRKEAAIALGWGGNLMVPEFKDKAYEMWLNDPVENVRVAAFVAWAVYYNYTADPKVLQYLYNIIRSHQYTIEVRTYAILALIEVSGEEPLPCEGINVLEMAELENQDELTKAIDWDRINYIMKKYVPNWKA